MKTFSSHLRCFLYFGTTLLALLLCACETTTTSYNRVTMSADQIAALRATAAGNANGRYATQLPANSQASTSAQASSSSHNRAIDDEVSAIMSGAHSPLPPARSVRTDSGSSQAKIEVMNNTKYTLTVLYSGPSSRRVELAAHDSQSITLAAGAYRVAAKVDNPNVVPFAGTDNLHGGLYDNTFYIVTR